MELSTSQLLINQDATDSAQCFFPMESCRVKIEFNVHIQRSIKSWVDGDVTEGREGLYLRMRVHAWAFVVGCVGWLAGGWGGRADVCPICNNQLNELSIVLPFGRTFVNSGEPPLIIRCGSGAPHVSWEGIGAFPLLFFR